MIRIFFALGSCSALLGVALGAFGAHLLKERLTPELLAIFEVGVRYQMYHAFGMLAVAWALSQFPGAASAAPGWLFAAGTVIFSGSLYVMSLTGMRWLGAVTPLGGLCFLAGWAWLAWGVWRGA